MVGAAHSCSLYTEARQLLTREVQHPGSAYTASTAQVGMDVGGADFITEGAGLEGEEDDERPAVYVDGLGLSAAVPRWLRWKGRLQVQDAGVQELEASIQHFWKVTAC
jgi:hypothetical protein